MRKIISFSIWGDNPIYSDGMLENIRLAAIVYPDWTVWVYVDSVIPQNVIEQMRGMGAEVILAEPSNTSISERDWDGLFWRFYPASDSSVDAFIVRDADSRLNSREKAAVDEWLNSDKGFHSMRDHWNHNVPIMGGMWGCKKGVLPEMRNYIREWGQYNSKGTDQIFLEKQIWDKVRETAFAHDRHCDGFFKLPGGEILKPQDISYCNKYDNCGGADFDYPRGKIKLVDGRVFQRLDVYHYDPIHLFGRHRIRYFPSEHLEIGRYIGESSQDYNKAYNPTTGQYENRNSDV